jgi:uncharacterized protein (TIGR02099 family)
VTPGQRRWRRARRLSLALVAGVLVSAAALLALGRLMVPWLIDSPADVADWLGERLGREVSLDSVSARWEAFGPLLELEGLRIAARPGEAPAISLGSARLQTDVYALLLPGRALIHEFLLVGAAVELVREADGRIRLRAFEQAGGGEPGVLDDWLGRVGHFGLTGGSVQLNDVGSGSEWRVDAVELRLRRAGDGLELGLERRAGAGLMRAVLHTRGTALTALAAGEFHIAAEDFPVTSAADWLAPLGIGARGGQLDGRLWGEIAAGRIAAIDGEISAADLVLAAPGFAWNDGGEVEPLLHLGSERIAVALDAAADGYHLDLTMAAGSAEAAALSLRWRTGAEPVVDARVESLPLAWAAGLAQLAQSLPQKLRASLHAMQPTGLIRELAFTRRDGHWQLHGDIEDTSWLALAPRIPGMAGLALSIDADDEAIALAFSAPAARFDLPGALRAPIEDLALAGRALWVSDSQGWRIEVPALDVAGPGFATTAELALSGGEDSPPRLYLRAHVPGAEVEAAKAFWILNKMPPNAVAWLDRALNGGRVLQGDVVYAGAFADWPFRGQEGRFEARFAVDGVNLDYHREWPRAEAVAAEAAFVNNSLRFERARGRIYGSEVSLSGGGIAELKEPILTLALAGEGESADYLRLLKESPLQRTLGPTLFGMGLKGPTKADVNLVVPLKKSLGVPSVEGHARLEGVHYTDTKWDLDFTEVRGRIDFTERGLGADRVSLKAAGHDTELALAVGTFCADPAQQVEARFTGRLPAQALFGQYQALAAILRQFEGAADWQIVLNVPKSPLPGVAKASLRYSSDLVGTAIGFPTPLAKTDVEARTLVLDVEIGRDEAPPRVSLALGPDFRVLADIGSAERDFRAEAQLGPAQAFDLPARGLRVRGRTPVADLPAWTTWILSTLAPGEGDPVLADLDVAIGEGAPAERLTLARKAGDWELGIEGERALGTVRFDSANAAVVAQFERLHVPEYSAGGGGEFRLSPRLLPTVHVYVGDLRIGPARLGQARLEAFPDAEGLRIGLLEARSPDLEVRARGQWLATGGAGESRFNIRFSSENLGRMLAGLGYAGLIDGGQTFADIEARWAGAPYGFALDRVTGTMDVSVGQGRFLDVDPGAGRIFGLLSLRELPRRLTLDFRDLFQSGMSFDRIEGRFQLADGNAWTEGLTVRSPAADILIIGRTGLASRDYDQQVMVSPHVTGVLPVIGGLAAGPVGAAAGFLAQGMAQSADDIERSSRVHYSVVGSWEKPVVARLMPVDPRAPPKKEDAG